MKSLFFMIILALYGYSTATVYRECCKCPNNALEEQVYYVPQSTILDNIKGIFKSFANIFKSKQDARQSTSHPVNSINNGVNLPPSYLSPVYPYPPLSQSGPPPFIYAAMPTSNLQGTYSSNDQNTNSEWPVEYNPAQSQTVYNKFMSTSASSASNKPYDKPFQQGYPNTYNGFPQPGPPTVYNNYGPPPLNNPVMPIAADENLRSGPTKYYNQIAPPTLPADSSFRDKPSRLAPPVVTNQPLPQKTNSKDENPQNTSFDNYDYNPKDSGETATDPTTTASKKPRFPIDVRISSDDQFQK